MLDKTSKNVLKFIISKYDGDTERDISIYPDEVNMGYTELNSLCELLHKQGIIDAYYASGHQTVPIQLYLSYKGLHYFEYERNERIELWKRNAWIPIIVSIITTLLTNYIIPMLPQILKWFCHIFE